VNKPLDSRIAFAQLLHEHARQVRGRYLNSAAVLELEIARLITAYFCDNSARRDFFFSEVATGQSLMFAAKIRLLTKILKRDFHPYLDGHPLLLGQLDSARKYRNDLAHATLDVSDAALGKTDVDRIGLVFFRDGEKQVRFVTLAESEERQLEINTLISYARELQMLLQLPYPGHSIDDSI
jgi:hypothetical protein